MDHLNHAGEYAHQVLHKHVELQRECCCNKATSSINKYHYGILYSTANCRSLQRR